MEHFLPLAVASMVISLISIILLDYFGPISAASESEELATPQRDAFDSSEEYAEKLVKEEKNKEITLEKDKPSDSNEISQPYIKHPSTLPPFFTDWNILSKLQQTYLV